MYDREDHLIGQVWRLSKEGETALIMGLHPTRRPEGRLSLSSDRRKRVAPFATNPLVDTSTMATAVLMMNWLGGQRDYART